MTTPETFFNLLWAGMIGVLTWVCKIMFQKIQSTASREELKEGLDKLDLRLKERIDDKLKYSIGLVHQTLEIIQNDISEIKGMHKDGKQ